MTLRFLLDRRSNPAKLALLDHVQILNHRVDIFSTTTHWFLYGADKDATRELLTPELNYWWKLIKEGRFERI